MKPLLRRALLGATLTLSLLATGCGSSGSVVTGPVGPAGAPGAPGAPGADGQLRIYGDGSAGAGIATDGTMGETVFANRNFQFTDFTVPAGITLTVPSGTVIRCTGTFRNLGTIVVRRLTDTSPSSTGQPGSAGSFGASFLGAVAGQATSSNSGVLAQGGIGARNASLPQLPYVVLSPVGGGTGTSVGADGGQGGGTFFVLAQAAAINDVTGSISANGQSVVSGGGGGGGGIITLASQTRVDNLAGGTLNAIGGDGGESDFLEGSGGGGGGGLIQLLAPLVTAPGAENVAGGTGAVAGGAGAANFNPRHGGGAGGASLGNGGNGGDVTAADTAQAGANGTAGQVFISAPVADPTSLFKKDS